MSESVLIWGGTGFIGRHLLEHLKSSPTRIVVATRNPAAESLLRDHVSADAKSTVTSVQIPGGRWNEALVDVIRSSSVIYNLAGASGAVDSNRDAAASLMGNCAIQADFLEACRRAGNRPHVVFASSRLVYGRPDSLPVDEKTPLSPGSYYAAHKICVENYHQIAAMQGDITFTICRISNPYGVWGSAETSGGWQAFINGLILRGCLGVPLRIFGDGQQLRDYIHAADLSRALTLCGSVSAARNEIFNIGSGESVAVCEAASIISELTGAPVEYSAWTREFELVESGDYVVDISKARGQLGFSPQYRFRPALEQIIKTVGRVDRAAAGAL